MPHDIATRPIAWAAAGIAAMVAVVVAGVFMLLRVWDMPADADRAALHAPVPIPGPALQSAPQLDLQSYRREKQQWLESAAWLDAQRTVARIPVADAMALLAARAASAASVPASGSRP